MFTTHLIWLLRVQGPITAFVYKPVFGGLYFKQLFKAGLPLIISMSLTQCFRFRISSRLFLEKF